MRLRPEKATRRSRLRKAERFDPGRELSKEVPPVSVRHFGNTANNAFFNHVILGNSHAVASRGLVNWTRHAMSAPAWEWIDFEVPNEGFVEKPLWSLIPEAESLHSACSLPSEAGARLSIGSLISMEAFEQLRWRALQLGTHLHRVPVGSRVVPWLKSAESQATPWARSSLEWAIAARSRMEHRRRARQARRAGGTQARPPAHRINIVYGPPAYVPTVGTDDRLVVVEHGTLRWTVLGASEDGEAREDFRLLVRRADHLWVTNPDELTVQLAEELAPSRWSALPHPYLLDPKAPFSERPGVREALLHETQSEFLILSPASMNWLPDHDKGTLTALDAFIALRKSGLPVGLLAMRWGRQVGEAQEILLRAGVSRYVHWMTPQPRIRLQQLLASVDVAWDQFRFANFGAFAIRAMEQGVPLIAHPMAKSAVAMMGERPPFLEASNAAQLEDQTRQVFAQATIDGRASVSEVGARQRSWLIRRHHQAITLALQVERYAALTLPVAARPDARPDAWAQMLDHSELEYPTSQDPSEIYGSPWRIP